MTADLRRFDYPLDTQLQRLRWLLDEQLAALATAQSAIAPLRERRDALAAHIAEQARGLAQAQARRLDPVRATRSVHYLAEQQRRHADVERELADAERLADQRRERLANTQAEIDKLERDRDECLREHVRETERRMQRETDQEWSARREWQARAAASRKERA
ncbi:MAG TPA: hypothetical protein VIP05_08115 [Burkholderiaceae bacterium]